MMNLKNKSKLLIILLSSLVISFSVFGRSPAVEPITGISIDQYKEVDPKNDPGFNWKQDSTRQARLKDGKVVTPYDSGTSITMTAIFLIAIVSFPIALWFALMKSFPATPNQTENTANHANTIDLAAERSKREDQESVDSDDHIHKAS